MGVSVAAASRNLVSRANDAAEFARPHHKGSGLKEEITIVNVYGNEEGNNNDIPDRKSRVPRIDEDAASSKDCRNPAVILWKIVDSQVSCRNSVFLVSAKACLINASWISDFALGCWQSACNLSK